MMKISNGTLTIKLHTPDSVEGYYRGTRFDWAGVFESIDEVRKIIRKWEEERESKGEQI